MTMEKGNGETMQRKIWDALPDEHDVNAIFLCAVDVYRKIPFRYASVRKALHRLKRDGFLVMQRCGRDYCYARKDGAGAPPIDDRGGLRA